MTPILRPIFVLTIATAALATGAGPLAAQIMRLPAVEAGVPGPSGQVLPCQDLSADVTAPPAETPAPPEPELPPGARAGVFQKLLFNGTWLASGGADGLGIGDLELKTVLGFPCPTIKSPLLVTPAFGAHFLDGPRGTDLPPRVYDASAEFCWMSQVTPSLGVDLTVTPGVFSDFDQSSKEQLRLTGHGAGAWTWTPTTKIVAGVGYFDRRDVHLLPIGGLIWNPSDDASFVLIFPAPRIAKRIYCFGGLSKDVQDWVYLAGEFGGATWAFRRDSGADDLFTYSDVRVILGLERKTFGGLGAKLEVGYVFSRKVEYWSRVPPDLAPADTVMLRGGLTY